MTPSGDYLAKSLNFLTVFTPSSTSLSSAKKFIGLVTPKKYKNLLSKVERLGSMSLNEKLIVSLDIIYRNLIIVL
jgi:hypothetical protein